MNLSDFLKQPFRNHSRPWTAYLAGAGVILTACGPGVHAQDTSGISATVANQIASLEEEKASRTPAQQKIDSQLLYAAKMTQGQAITNAVPSLELSPDVFPDEIGRVDVDIDANVTPSVIKLIQNSGGKIMSSFPQYNAIRVRLPLASVELVAGSEDVRFIRPAVQAEVERVLPAADAGPLVPPDRMAARARVRAQVIQLIAQARERRNKQTRDAWATLGGFSSFSGLSRFSDMVLGNFTLAASMPGVSTDAGSVDSQGDSTHRAIQARSVFGADGTGIKVGVLSDSIDDSSGSYAAAIASGDVPNNVTVLPGQAGSGAAEGLAMLEIVHDLAPGAQLYFATAFSGPASFAQNIRDLRAAGCDIIIDDVGYFNESPFQDDLISQAVSDVTASGALYFSSASNSGNLDQKTSGTWEGDFNDGGVLPANSPISNTKSYHVHLFTGTDQLTGAALSQAFDAFPAVAPTGSSRRGEVFWSDPLGKSTNDYDLFYLSADGSTILHSSTNVQNGSQDPYETFGIADTESPFINKRFVIVKAAGAAARFLHFDTGRGYITIATPGVTRGHSAVPAAFSTAATPSGAPADPGVSAGRVAAPQGPYPNAFSSANGTEGFSSDGPRRVFYNVDGTPITPGNLSSTGGSVRPKPDITAADGVNTTLPSASGLNPFYGTSAAAPHAGAIAALLKSFNPTLTLLQYRAALTGTAIDIDGPGYDRDSGFGIVDAVSALASVPAAALTSVSVNPAGVSGGASTTGTVTIHDPAPAGGATVTLTASGPASVPASVLVSAGQTAATFPVSTSAVTATTTATIQAVYAGVTRATTLAVVAQYAISGRVTTTTGAGVNGVAVSTQVPAVVALPTQTDSTVRPIADGTGTTGPIGGAPTFSSVTVTGTGTIGSVRVGVNISHTYRGDLQVTLIAPDGTSVLLKDTSSDSTANLVTSYPDQTQPVQSLSALFGKPIAGTWQLKVQDFYAGDTGTVNSFSLTLGQNTTATATATTDATGAYAFANFSPGTFTLTPFKAGFGFTPASRTVTVGPDQTNQNFTLSQPGIRTSVASVAAANGGIAVTILLANGGSNVSGVTLTRASLGTAAAPSSPSLPNSVGAISSGTSTSVTLQYPRSAGAAGATVPLRVSGTLDGNGSFSGSFQVVLP